MTDSPNKPQFPMPLEAFERYMLADDWSPYPADGFLRLTFRGPLCREMFEGAIEAALARHPLMQAWVDQDARGCPIWIEAGDKRPFITWDPNVRPANCRRGHGIDLRHEIGARFFLTEADDRTELLIQMHHACCDGLALVQITEDLLVEYQRRVNEPSEAPPSRLLDRTRLLRRGRFGLGRWGYLKRLPLDLAAGLAAFEYFGHRPAHLGPFQSPPHDAAVADDYPALISHTLTLKETERLRTAAKQQGVTMNDLMLRDLFVALHGRLVADDPRNLQRIVRIMVPMNLRILGDEATPAANLVSMTYLDRRPVKFSDSAKLLRSIHREMRLLKWFRAGITLARAIRIAEFLPGGLRGMLPYDRCLATAVLSNLGVAERVIEFPQTNGLYRTGGVVLEGIGAAPPLRPMTRASFVTITYAGRLEIMLHFDSHVLNDCEGRDLLNRFVDRLRQS